MLRSELCVRREPLQPSACHLLHGRSRGGSSRCFDGGTRAACRLWPEDDQRLADLFYALVRHRAEAEDSLAPTPRLVVRAHHNYRSVDVLQRRINEGANEFM